MFCIQDRLGAESSRPDVVIRTHAFAGVAFAPATGERVSSSPQLDVWRTDSGYFLRCGDSHLELELETSTARGAISPSLHQLGLADRREFFMLTFLMLLRRHGVFGLHANAVVDGDRATIIAASSGSGKTSLTLGLIGQGFDYVSDDAIGLHYGDDGHVQARGLRSGFSCTQETLQHFPALLTGTREALGTERDKCFVDGATAFPGQSRTKCQPSILLFPRLAGDASTRVSPLTAAQAYMNLYRQSPGILTAGAESRAQVQTLQALVGQCRSYEFLQGREILDTPELAAKIVRDLEGA